MKREGVKKHAMLATVGVLVAAQVSTAFAAAGTLSGPSVPMGAWVQNGQDWSYLNADGSVKKGWIQTASGWYYLDPITGKMKTGWVEIGGQRYYLNTAADGVEGQMRQGWWQDAAGKQYFFSTASDGSAGQLLTGWQWIDGKCYYFEAADATKLGQLYLNGTTPDGYSVNAAGQWQNELGLVQTRAEQGYASTAASANAAGQSTAGSSSNSGSGNSSGNTSAGGAGSDSENSGSDTENNGNQNGGGNSDSSGKPGGSDTENSGKPDSGEDTASPESTADLVDETKTKLREVNSLGWWLPIVYEKGYTAENTVVTVDGVDVTSALTKVTDDGSIGKLALLTTPGTIRIRSKEDSDKYETIELSAEAKETSAQSDAENTESDVMTEGGAVYTGEAYLPEKILGHATVPMWDYYLTNYDDAGKARVTPTKTTYDLGETKTVHASYAPDAILKEDEKGNVSGTVTIMFNYNTEDEKSWFDAIEKLALVSYDEQKKTLNADLTFEMKKNVAHGKGHVGKLEIPIGQTNFRNNGRYYVRVTSSAGETTLVPIHVVNEKKPELTLKETAQSGKNLHFAVSNLIYGITSPVERVTLKTPNGDIEELQKFDDWYLLSQNLFVLYNDKTNHLVTQGKYTLTIYANGFQTFSKSFGVTSGEASGEKAKSARKSRSAYSVDAVSSATSGGSSSGSTDSDSSSSLAVSANLIFDTDLLVNAYILEDAEKANDAVNAVIAWWESTSQDAVYSTDDTALYDWDDYVDECEGEKTENDRMLSYAEYCARGEIYASHPAAAKEVLEDGLLGDIQQSSSFIPKDDTEHGTETNLSLKAQYDDDAEAFTATKGDSEKYYADATFEVTGSEGDFLKNLDSMTIQSLNEDDAKLRYVYAEGVSSRDDVYYEVSENGKSVTLHQVQPGEYELTLYAKYYENTAVSCEFKVEKEAEEETPDETSIDIRVRAVRKENGFFTSGYVIQFSYNDGSGITGSDLEKALETYVKSIEGVTVGTTEYSVATSRFNFGAGQFLPFTYDSAYGNQKDSLLLSFSGFDTTGDTTVTIGAGDGYPEVEFIIDQNGKLKKAATSESSISEEVKASDEEVVSKEGVLTDGDTVISGKADAKGNAEADTEANTKVNSEAKTELNAGAEKTDARDDLKQENTKVEASEDTEKEDAKAGVSEDAEQDDEKAASSADARENVKTESADDIEPAQDDQEETDTESFEE